jgi:hypothetical protein
MKAAGISVRKAIIRTNTEELAVLRLLRGSHEACCTGKGKPMSSLGTDDSSETM